MKKTLTIILPFAVILLVLSSVLCQGETKSPVKSEASNKVDNNNADVRYTFLKECKETVMNENAAFSELTCPDLLDYKVRITQQSPQYFNIILKQGVNEASTDFTVVSHNQPVKEGKAIEWHIQNNVPQYMIFRLSWGTEAEPFKMREYLVLNLVTSKEICALATVDVKNNRDTNEKIRGLLLKEFKDVRTCPESVQAY